VYVRIVPMLDDENSQSQQPKISSITDLRAQALERSKRQALHVNRSFQPGQDTSLGGSQPPKPKPKMMPDFWYRLSRKGQVLVSLVVVLVLAAASFAVYTNFINKEKGAAGTVKTAEKVAQPTTVASPLTGVQVPPELAARPVTAIMLENSLDARPQSGVAEAGVVFEAIAEGGITRFIALYQEDQPQYIGPVRSLRPYYIDWAVPFDASIAHVGGSPDALSQIRNGGKDLDQFFNSGSYSRISSRAAPHNLYTSFEKLDALNKSKGYNGSTFKSWPRKEDQKLAVPTARTIDMPISSPNFYVHYDYHADDNSYWRSEGGGPHMSIGSANDSIGQPVHPRVVIVLVMPYGIAADGQHSEYSTYGSGSAYIFQDGGVTNGTWHKADRNAQFEFKDANGQTIKLNAGRVWVTPVSSGQMSYVP